MLNMNLNDILIVIGCLIVSLVVHEFMHGYVGYLLGDTTAKDEGRLTLNPLRHVDPFMTVLLPAITLILFRAPILAAKPVPFNPDRVKFDEFGAALLAAAGPLSNLLLAIVGIFAANLFNITQPEVLTILQDFIYLNVLIFVFNAIPIPPLDGSRVLYAFAPEALQEFMRNIEPYGFIILIAIVLLAGNVLVNVDQYVYMHLLNL